MVFLDWKNLPWFWQGSEHLAWALSGGGGAGLLALVFGWLAFRSRIKGVYFSIITRR
jgi:urea transport system permease protein